MAGSTSCDLLHTILSRGRAVRAIIESETSHPGRYRSHTDTPRRCGRVSPQCVHVSSNTDSAIRPDMMLRSKKSTNRRITLVTFPKDICHPARNPNTANDSRSRISTVPNPSELHDGRRSTVRCCDLPFANGTMLVSWKRPTFILIPGSRCRISPRPVLSSGPEHTISQVRRSHDEICITPHQPKRTSKVSQLKRLPFPLGT
jgi:hypothetical protein